MQILNNIDLKNRHTLSASALARELVILESLEEYKVAKKGDFILGGGSNVIFCNEIKQRIIQPLVKGREIVGETRDHIYLQIHAGENWHQTVQFIAGNGWYGAENLALIPGLVGAAPVQNIGAYGIEIKDIIASVQVFDLYTKTFKQIRAKDCGFAYRYSYFKDQWRNRYLITAVTLQLAKKAKLKTSYAGLREQADTLDSPQAVIDAVIKLRQSKLPDPIREPNVGSFFHNPIINRAHYGAIKMLFPNVPFFPAGKKIKIPAAWCIEQCGFKGIQIGSVGISPKHALVLVNYGGTGEEILAFAREIQSAVWKRFSLSLKIEPTIVGEIANNVRK